MHSHVAILGAGNIGLSIAEGLMRAGWPSDRLYLTRRNASALSELKNRGVNVGSDNTEAVRNADLIIVAVKPYKVTEVLSEIADSIKPGAAIVSVASGVKMNAMRPLLRADVRVFRAMPGIGAAVGQSASCVAGDYSTGAFQQVEAVFSSVGEVVRIDEELMEAATVLGACGVAFVLRFMRAMIQGGIQIGFDAETAGRIVAETVRGAATLIGERSLHPEEAIDRVTTPRGCTIVGLNEMEHSGFSSALIKGLVASFQAIDNP